MLGQHSLTLDELLVLLVLLGCGVVEGLRLLRAARGGLWASDAHGYTPLQLAMGENGLVSRKPGVTAVLEEAARNPYPQWVPPRGRAGAGGRRGPSRDETFWRQQ